MIEAVNHIGISTSNIDRLLTFYRDLIGMKIIANEENIEGDEYDIPFSINNTKAKVVLLELGQFQLEIFQFCNPETESNISKKLLYNAGFNQIGFRVKDIESEYQRLKKAGITFLSPPRAISNIEKDLNTEKCVYGRDPDGNIFELFELFPPSRNESMTNG